MSPRDRSGGLDGVLNVAKPSGPTSHDVVGLIRRLSSTRRVGHGGTLDPFAAGVLPVFLGRATRLVEYHLGAAKRYRATVCFGETSTTDDIDGDRTPIAGPALSREAVEAALAGSSGRSGRSRPTTARSRWRAAGRTRWHGRARRSSSRPGTSSSTRPTMLEWDDTDPARPMAVVDVECSAGTYIRALARDLGARLESGAYLGALVRTASGGFRLEDTISFEELREHAADGPAGIERVLRPIDAGLEDLPHAAVTSDEIRRLGEGLITAPKSPLVLRDAPLVLAVGPDGKVVAVCKAVAGALHPHKVLAERPAESGRPVRRPAPGATEAV